MRHHSYLTKPLPKKIIAILLLCALISGCLSYPKFATVNDNALITIDEELFNKPMPNNQLGGLVVVPASINGVDGFEFVLDTGAAGTVIFESSKTQALNLNTDGTYNVGGSGEGARAQAKIGVDVDISIGGATINDMAPLIMSGQDVPLFESEDDVFIDGIIGYDLFNRFIVDINPADKTVQLYHPHDSSFINGLVTTKLPINFTHRRITTDIEVIQTDGDKGFTTEVLLDSGSTGGLSLVEGQNGITVPSNSKISSSLGLQGKTTYYSSIFSSIDLAGIEIKNLPTDIATSKAESLLGAKVLNRFRQIIDYQNEQILLLPQNVEKPFNEITFGLKVRPSGSTYVTYDLSKDQPAYAAGLRDKDNITSVNGVSTAQLNYRELLDMDPSAGDLLNVCYSREGYEKRCIEITAS